MAKFLFWSDLHCDFEPFDIPRPAEHDGALPGAPSSDEIDAILIPGDIAPKGAHLDWLVAIWDIWRKPVLAVAGNHEPYGAKRFQKHLAQEIERLGELRSQGIDIDVMRKATRIIGDTRIIGATLWTDMELYPEMSGYAHVSIRGAMNDYRKVQWFDEKTGIYRKMAPHDTKTMHREELAYILAELERPFDGRTVVMTHHLPVLQALSDKRQARRDVISGAYASDLWPRLGMMKVDAWIHGHSHDAQEVCLEGAEGPVAFLSNIKGYPFETTRFEPLRVLDSNDPLLGSSINHDRERAVVPDMP